MNADPTFDRDKLIAVIYQIQTDLRILAEQLAREPDVKIHECALQSLQFARMTLTAAHPSLSRH